MDYFKKQLILIKITDKQIVIILFKEIFKQLITKFEAMLIPAKYEEKKND